MIRSGLLSPFKSPISMSFGILPTLNSVIEENNISPKFLSINNLSVSLLAVASWSIVNATSKNPSPSKSETPIAEG